MKYLVLDITNILYRTFFTHKTEDITTLTGLATHAALVTINKYYRQFKPHKIIMCFDRDNNWRKQYTLSDKCISKKVYKGNRRQKMTPKEKEKYAIFLSHVGEFENLIRYHTSIIVLAGEALEADDLVGGTIQTLSITDPEAEFIVVSADKDMMQFISDNVILMDPASGKARTLKDFNNDVKYFMYEKCIRGDLGDNVQSALPRVRKTRIQKAYEDPYEHANLMAEHWNGIDGTDFCVKDLFYENQLLMDLSKQPEDIQKRIITTVLEGVNNPGTFSFFHFMKFLGKYELKKIAEQAEQFAPMFSR